MHFFVRKRRPTPSVIIVALIDVLIVLLIFLMVTTTFRQQAALRLALPESTQSQKTGADEHAPFVVSIDAKGVVRIGDDLPITDERLKEEMITRSKNNPDLRVAINADKDAPFGKIIKVMDAAKEAHIKAVNAFTKEVTK
jgi:biopolymer transport protein ExbD